MVSKTTKKMLTLWPGEPTAWYMSNKNAKIYPSRCAQECHSIYNNKTLLTIYMSIEIRRN